MRNCISWLLCFLGYTIYAQEPAYIQYSTENGLPSATAYCVTQDKDGFIWVGTENGASRFDGTTFETFNFDNGLTENEVFLIWPDHKKRVWFVSFGNNLCYYKNGKIFSYRNTSYLNKRIESTGLLAFFDNGKEIWMGGGKYLIRADEDSLYFNPPSLPSPKALNASEIYNENGRLKILCNQGIFYRLNDTLIHEKRMDPKKIKREYGIYVKNLVHCGNEIYGFYFNRLVIFKADSDSNIIVHSIRPLQSNINKIKVEQPDKIWILMQGNGALCVRQNTTDTSYYLPGKNISDLFIDRENNIWFSALGDGVYFLKAPEAKTYSSKSGFSSDVVCSVTGDKNGNIWAGLNNGIIHAISSGNVKTYNLGGLAGARRILSISSNNKEVYFGTDRGVFQMDEFKKTKLLIDTAEAIKYLKAITPGSLLVGSSAYGYIYDFRNGKFNIKHSWIKRTTSICEAEQPGEYYFGSIDGVFKFKNNSFTKYDSIVQQLNDRITCMAKSDSGIYWVSTHNSGIVAFQNNDRRVLTRENGLLSNSCRHLFIDEKQQIWISTNKGLNKIIVGDWKKNKFQVSAYTISDGLASNEVNQCYVRNDTVWAATVKGLTVFKDGTLRSIPPPEIYLEGLIATDSTFNFGNNYSLRHDQNEVTFQFRGVSFTALGNLTYKYRLSGLENEWKTSGQNNIRYANLAPGNYTFEVFAIHPKGLSSVKPATVSFFINKPFWKTIGFKTGLLIFILSSGFTLVYFRLNRKRKEEELRSRLLQSEITSLRSQINPHFIFNSLNSIQDFIFKNEKENANHYLAEFSHLIRMILDNSRESMVTLSDEINFLTTYLKLEKLRLDDRLNYSIFQSSSLESDFIKIPSMIIQPFAENAILHGIAPKKSPGNLLVEFTTLNGSLLCVIEDDGVGRTNKISKSGLANGYKPFGIKATDNRIRLINQKSRQKIEYEIKDLSEIDPSKSGTRVEIKISNVK